MAEANRLSIDGYTLDRGMWEMLAASIVIVLTACSPSEPLPVLDLTERVSENELRELLNKQSITQDVFNFGFDLRASPLEDARQYLPFLRYLERATGYRFKLYFTPGEGRIIDELGEGTIHFAAIGAGSYIRSHEQYKIIPVVRGLSQDGHALYRSAIVVTPNSPLSEISDLIGKRFAFGSITSTQGHLIPRILLRKHGIDRADLAVFEYTGSHQKCANAVISGRFDACGMQDTMADALSRQGMVRILAYSAYYPSSGIAANRDIPSSGIEADQKGIVGVRSRGTRCRGTV